MTNRSERGVFVARYDEIGYWSAIKLDIVREYAEAYSRSSATERSRDSITLISTPLGAGIHILKTTGDFVPGSPLTHCWWNPL